MGVTVATITVILLFFCIYLDTSTLPMFECLQFYDFVILAGP